MDDRPAVATKYIVGGAWNHAVAKRAVAEANLVAEVSNCEGFNDFLSAQPPGLNVASSLLLRCRGDDFDEQSAVLRGHELARSVVQDKVRLGISAMKWLGEHPEEPKPRTPQPYQFDRKQDPQKRFTTARARAEQGQRIAAMLRLPGWRIIADAMAERSQSAYAELAVSGREHARILQAEIASLAAPFTALESALNVGEDADCFVQSVEKEQQKEKGDA